MNITIQDYQNFTKNINHTTPFENGSRNTEDGKKVAESAAFFMGSGNNIFMGKDGSDMTGMTPEDIANSLGAVDVEKTKDYMTVVASGVSEDDFKKLSENGFDVSELEPDEMVTLTDEIRATLAQAGVVVSGFNDDLDPEVLENITGSVSAAKALVDSFKAYDVPFTKENMDKAVEAVNLGLSVSGLSESAENYILGNDLSLSIENVYKASHSGVAGRENASYIKNASGYDAKMEKGHENLGDQVKEKLASFGVPVNEENIKTAEALLDSGIGLTEENFLKKQDMERLSLPLTEEDLFRAAARGLKEYGSALKGILGERESLLDKSVKLVEKVNDITDEQVSQVVKEGSFLTIKNLDQVEGVETEPSENFVQAKRMLEEVRLSMTVSSTYTLYKLGIRVDTLELSKLVEDLKVVEEKQAEILFGKEDALEKYSLYQMATTTVNEVKGLPEEVLGRLGQMGSQYSSLRVSQVSIETVANEGRTIALSYAKAEERYETLWTAPRADLGDSITKAFRNIDELLSENGFEATEENAKATRILSRCQMEISAENLEEVKEANRLLIRVIEKLTPAATMKLIREGENPLNLSLEALDQKLSKMDEAKATENYARFLVNLEDRGEITEEERSGYIGIYRMIHQIETKDSAALGEVLKEGGELSFKRLLSAVRSRNHAGMNLQIDDEQGFLDTVISKGTSITEQLSKAFESSESMAYEKGKMEEVQESSHVKDEVVRLLSENEIPATTNNLLAAKRLLSDRKAPFKKAKELTSKNTEQAEKNIDFDGMTKDLLERFTDVDSAKAAYESYMGTLEDSVQEEILKADSVIDLKALQSTHHQIHLAKEMASSETYEIPMEIGGELSTVTLRMEKGEAAASIRMELEGGELNARMIPTEQGYSITLITDMEQVKEALEEKREQIKEKLPEEAEISILVSKKLNNRVKPADKYNNKVSSTDGEQASAKNLYEMSKALILALAE